MLNTKLLIGSAVVGAALLLAGCGAGSGDGAASATSQTPADSMSATPMAELTGAFVGENDKSVEGTATISDGEVVLSGFSSDEGPDLHLYLANGTDEAAVAAGVELGDVAFDEASQTFAIDVDASGYTDLVVHCDKANAVFGAAELM
ncbi:DM13 domain-containing protein [Microbacterium indicum]|uniref:DM13 domain-containing protein n=1 Tax=Microbacterium indicum TaxID=358100 RepID=UPI0003F94536|nr:DM13 domain-containing protein [Microbacterium indicum]